MHTVSNLKPVENRLTVLSRLLKVIIPTQNNKEANEVLSHTCSI